MFQEISKTIFGNFIKNKKFCKNCFKVLREITKKHVKKYEQKVQEMLEKFLGNFREILEKHTTKLGKAFKK